MKSEWPSVRLGDCCLKIGSGATPRGGQKSYLDDGPVALIRSQNVYNAGFQPEGLAYISDDQAAQLDNVVVELGDVLVNITGDSVARVCSAPPEVLPARVNQHVAIVRPRPDLFDARYLRYFFVSPHQQALLLSMAGGGGTRKALTKGMLENLRIPMPPIRIQRNIVEPLELIDRAIAVYRSKNTTLESIAEAIFKSWFIDFDPVHAKSAGQEPTGMDAETAALFPSEFEESVLGPIPKGWTTSTVGTRFEIVMGQSPPGHTYNEEGKGTPFYQGRTDFGFRFPGVRVYCTAPTRFARANDVLLSVRAPVGDINVALQDCSIGRGVAAIHGGDAPSFALYTMRNFATEFSQFESEGTVFGSINRRQLEGLRFVLPPDGIERRFEELTSIMDARIRVNELSIRTLTALRDTLLPRLISGRLRIPEAEEIVQEAVS